MNAGRNVNPFHLLALPIEATDQEVVRRVKELRQTTTDEERRALNEWALAEINRNPATRAFHERTEPPGADYEPEIEWAEFVEDHVHPIARSTPFGQEDVRLDLVADVLRDWLIGSSDTDLSGLFEQLPARPEDGAPQLEARDVLFG